jgi:ribonuclease Y
LNPKPRESHSPVGLEEARAQAREIVVEAKSEAVQLVKKAEEEAARFRQEVLDLERKLAERENQLAVRATRLGEREDKLGVQSKELEEVREELLTKLEKAALLSKEEARREILSLVEREAEAEKARIIRNAGEAAKEEAQRRAKDILITAIQRVATNFVAEYTTSRVKLPDENFKGRVIGFKGRNIQAFERATGVTVDLDEAPDEVRLSCFDGVKREVARLALERLIADGRIQPGRIEEEVKRAQGDLEKELREVGEKVAYEAGVYGLPEDLLSLVGRYKFRTSYGQNLAAHSLEVVNIAKMLALELGADVEVVKKAALLHDVGKVKTAEAEGSHARLTRQILEQFRFEEKIINAAAAHHEEEPFGSLEAVLIQIADAVSGARPGARFEDYEEYLKRMKALEETALTFPEVKEAYALSAGRQLRVVVRPEKVDDASLAALSQQLARKIEKEQVYPGQIEVTVIKELRATQTAR